VNASGLEKEHLHLERVVLNTILISEGVHVLAEVGPLVAVFKPRGLHAKARFSDEDCLLFRLADKCGGTWSVWKQVSPPKTMCGVAFCAKASEVATADQATRDLPLELWFDAVVYAQGAGFVLEDALLPLPAVGCQALLCKLYEVGRLAHILAKVVVAGGTGSSVGEVADALTNALGCHNCPIVGRMRDCRRLKSQNALKCEKLLSLSRAHCASLDSGLVPPDICLEHVLMAERITANTHQSCRD